MKHLIVFFCLFLSMNFFGQRYKNAFGLRYATIGSLQLNAKHFVNDDISAELSLGGNLDYVWFQGNLNWQVQNALDTDFYIGAGPGFGIVSGESILGNSSSSKYMYGVNLFAGGEYVDTEFPISLSFETGPYLQVSPNLTLGWNFGVAARYVIP